MKAIFILMLLFTSAVQAEGTVVVKDAASGVGTTMTGCTVQAVVFEPKGPANDSGNSAYFNCRDSDYTQYPASNYLNNAGAVFEEITIDAPVSVSATQIELHGCWLVRTLQSSTGWYYELECGMKGPQFASSFE